MRGPPFFPLYFLPLAPGLQYAYLSTRTDAMRQLPDAFKHSLARHKKCSVGSPLPPIASSTLAAILYVPQASLK